MPNETMPFKHGEVCEHDKLKRQCDECFMAWTNAKQQVRLDKLEQVAKAAKALTRPGDKLPKGTKAQSDYYMNAMKALDAALAEMEAK
jgi:hypothetical protein